MVAGRKWLRRRWEMIVRGDVKTNAVRIIKPFLIAPHFVMFKNSRNIGRCICSGRVFKYNLWSRYVYKI